MRFYKWFGQTEVVVLSLSCPSEETHIPQEWTCTHTPNMHSYWLEAAQGKSGLNTNGLVDPEKQQLGLQAAMLPTAGELACTCVWPSQTYLVKELSGTFSVTIDVSPNCKKHIQVHPEHLQKLTMYWVIKQLSTHFLRIKIIQTTFSDNNKKLMEPPSSLYT